MGQIVVVEKSCDDQEWSRDKPGREKCCPFDPISYGSQMAPGLLDCEPKWSGPFTSPWGLSVKNIVGSRKVKVNSMARHPVG